MVGAAAADEAGDSVCAEVGYPVANLTAQKLTTLSASRLPLPSPRKLAVHSSAGGGDPDGRCDGAEVGPTVGVEVGTATTAEAVDYVSDEVGDPVDKSDDSKDSRPVCRRYGAALP